MRKIQQTLRLLVVMTGVTGVTMVLGVVGSGRAHAQAAAGGPMAQIKATNERIDHLLKKKKSDNDEAAKAEMRTIVNAFLDYEEVAKRGLAQHWESLSKGQQGEFVTLLRQLVERNYEKQLKGNTEYQVIYKTEVLTDGESLVTTIVKVKTKGKGTETAIDYKMKKQGERWMVYDVITDGVSMVKNYRTQWNKIITNDGGFEALLKKMRQRVKDLASDDHPPAAGAAGAATVATTPGTSANTTAGAPTKPAKPGGKTGGTKTIRAK